MDLVAGDGLAAGNVVADDLDRSLVAGQHCVDRQQAEAAHRTGAALDAAGVSNALPQHLVAAAETEHASTAAAMGEA